MANLGDALVIEAKKHLGKDYISGGLGRGPDMFDCSGLVNYSIMQVSPGMNFYWSVDYQYGAMPGGNIARANVRPGDILFFVDTPGTSALTHNGIFVGGSQFIHAKNETSGVVYDDLNATWWSSRLKYIKRVWPYSDVPQPDPDPGPDPMTPLNWGAGDLVNVVSAHNLRVGSPPLFENSEVGLALGAQLAITGPHAVHSSGYIWWPVKIQSGYGVAGWARQDKLKLAFADAFGTYKSRDLFDVIGGHTIREGTAFENFTVGTTVLREGDRIICRGLSSGAGSATWIPIIVAKNADFGWAKCNLIKLVARGVGSFPAENGYTNKVIAEPLNLRAAPTTSGTLIGTMPVGTLLRVHDGPTMANGYRWFKVEAQGFGNGYCVDGFVTTMPQNYPQL